MFNLEIPRDNPVAIRSMISSEFSSGFPLSVVPRVPSSIFLCFLRLYLIKFISHATPLGVSTTISSETPTGVPS